ncbi:alpha/beta hydrolase [Humisphaera borealis]|uniref:Alpha/beta hydrolase n=1 Tax=Humisphaera borealis TaxID=2807512 RepID=A0A7M2WT95_9BACT|nr:alpha/beta hydrolase [Humisphaera borealis]QOV88686.1 alpha/beta hydrolase [Humisphaera borealis]
MRYTIGLIGLTVGFATFAHSVAAGADAPVKLLEPKPLTAGHKVVALFPPGHPALKAGPGSDQEEKFNTGGGRVSAVTNIHNPSIELYLAPPDKANGMSVILSPGGGNNTCNVGPEGTDIAAWFNSVGVSCFVHRYRLKPYGSATDALLDTQRAIRTVRANAKEWNIDPNKIGHMGFSAGGEQTARIVLTFDAGKADAADPIDRVSSRPDWVVLVYPGWVPGSLDLSNVPKDLPPTFLVCAGTGDVFHAKQTVEFYNALFEVGKSMKPKPLNIEMHIYGAGAHGGAISPRKGIPFGTWHQRFVEWATDLKLMPAAVPAESSGATPTTGK